MTPRASKYSISLKWRFVLLMTFVLVVVFTSLALVLINNSSAILRKNLNDRSIAFSELATKPIGESFYIYKDSGKIQIDKQVRDFLTLNEDVIRVTILDLEGIPQYQLATSKNLPAIPSSIDPKNFEKSTMERDELLYITIPYFETNLSHRYSIVYTVSRLAVDKAIQKEAVTLALFSTFGLMVSAALAFLFVNSFILQPIAVVSEQAKDISGGDLEKQINSRRHDEIGSLASSVNQMAKSLKDDIVKLQELDKVKTEFMMIISHNLLTPLTTINGYLENAELFTTQDQYKDAMQHIADSARRLGVFAEDVLTISKLELGKKLMSPDQVESKPFFEELARELSSSSSVKKINFTFTIGELPKVMLVSVPLLRSAIYNIFENSLKFTKSGGTVSLTVGTVSDALNIAISDTGIGISQEELPKLFTKFHRGTSTLTYDYEGIGMGLYASKVMIEANGGTITATSVLGQGSTFTIQLPIIQQEQN